MKPFHNTELRFYWVRAYCVFPRSPSIAETIHTMEHAQPLTRNKEWNASMGKVRKLFSSSYAPTDASEGYHMILMQKSQGADLLLLLVTPCLARSMFEVSNEGALCGFADHD